MEIEAKFTLSDRATFQQLQEIEALAGYHLAASEVRAVQDEYLDTTDRQLLGAGYACRRRTHPDGVLMTLKGLGGAEGAVHRREELEIQLPTAQPVEAWPDSSIRERIMAITGAAPLHLLFGLSQTRTVRQVSLEARVVAELSLDDVHLSLDGVEDRYLELEVEQAPDGGEADLAAIVAHLRDEWQLEPERRSKFERGLALVDGASAPEIQPKPAEPLLSQAEQVIFQQIAEHEDETYRRRALALLALNQGASTKEAGQQASLSASRVRHWRAAFQKKGVKVFPDTVLAQYEPLTPAAKGKKSKKAKKGKKKTKKAAQATTPEVQLSTEIGLQPDDSMAEAAYKTFQFHLQCMIFHEPGVRLGEDIEELHDMRVATRRMRAAYQIYAPYLKPEVMRPYIKGLRRTGRALGDVRDLDVFWEKTEGYQQSLPDDQQGRLASLERSWQKQHKTARKAMLKYLDSKRYRRFKADFAQFLEDPAEATASTTDKKGFPLPQRLKDVIPIILYQRLAAVQAYDEFVTDPNVPVTYLHQLRIVCKGLRYALEFFSEVLDPEAQTLIKTVKTLQNHLGDLQDAYVAGNVLREYLVWGSWDHQAAEQKTAPRQTIIDPGAAAYLANREQECQTLIDTFPPIWSHFKEAGFKDLLGDIVAKL